MGLIKWLRRRIEEPSIDQKPLNNQIDETGYVRPIEIRFQPQQLDDVTRHTSGLKFKGMRKLFRRHRAKSLTNVNHVSGDACKERSKKSSLVTLNLESPSRKTVVDHLYDEIPARRYANVQALSPTMHHSTACSYCRSILFPRSQRTQCNVTREQLGIVHPFQYRGGVSSLVTNLIDSHHPKSQVPFVYQMQYESKMFHMNRPTAIELDIESECKQPNQKAKVQDQYATITVKMKTSLLTFLNIVDQSQKVVRIQSWTRAIIH